MNIIIGRRKRRVVYELPHGQFIAKAAVDEPATYKEFSANICRLLKIPGYV